MKKSKHHTLHRQIMLICIVSIILFSIVSIIFFQVMCNILLRQEQEHIEDVMNQVEEKVNSSAQNSMQYAEYISKNTYVRAALTETDAPTNYNNVLTLSEIIPGLTQSNQAIRGVLLLDLFDIFLGINQKMYSIVEQIEQSHGVFSLTSYPDGFTGMLQDAYEGKKYYACIKTIFQTGPQVRLYHKIGSCIILNDLTEFETALDQISLPDQSAFLILDGNQQVIATQNKISSEEKDPLPDILKRIKSSERGNATEYIQNEEYLIQHKKVSSTGWTVLSVIPLDEVNKDLYLLSDICIAIFLFVIVLFLFLQYRISKSITAPLQKMTEFMGKGGYHSLKNRLQISQNNEIGDLAEQINFMLDEIDDLTKKIVSTQSHMYEVELEKKKAELSALYSQINPHFLYNTLECIRGYGYLLNSTEIVEITSALSFIMRYSIKGPEFVPVEQEMLCVRKYLTIISIRFENRFDFQLNLSEEILLFKIPRFILQPIVENAVYHGLEPKLSQGIVEIKARRENRSNSLLIEITDNGVGIPKDILTGIQNNLSQMNAQSTLNTFSEHSIGILNIQNRIKNIYGTEYGLTIQSRQGEGTCVSIRLPIQKD